MKQRELVILANAVKQNVTQAFLDKQKSELIMHFLQADDEDDEGNRLRVLNDGDGVKLLMDVYTSYVSDDDFVKFPKFMRDVDTLLYKARGNRGLTKEDRLAMEEEASAAPRKSKKKKSKAPPPPANDTPPDSSDNSNTEVTASDTDADIEDFFTRYLRQAG